MTTVTVTGADPKGTERVSRVLVVAMSTTPPGCPRRAPATIPGAGVATAEVGIRGVLTLTPLVALSDVSLPCMSIPVKY